MTPDRQSTTVQRRVRQSPRYRVVETAPNRARLYVGDRAVAEYWAPLGGGYVREVTDARPGTLGSQVCDRLASTGPTLWCSGPLARLIRVEMRALVRWCARERLDLEDCWAPEESA